MTIIDVSSNQHPNGAGINWGQVKASGIQAVIIKATEGLNYRNPYYPNDLAGALSAGLDVLAYHFAGTSPAAEEAAYFEEYAGSKYAKVLDIETSQNWPWAQTFLQTLDLPPSELLTYGSASTLVAGYQRLPSMAWPAAYGQNYPGWGVLWQYTDQGSVPGITGSVDLSSWHGTETQYDTLFSKFDPPTPTPPGDADEMFPLNPTQQQFNVCLRYSWYTLRQDPITQQDFDLYWVAWNEPIANKGFGQVWDLVVAQVHDTKPA